MATLASLLVAIGVKLDGDLKVEQRLRGLRTAAQKLGESGKNGASLFANALSKIAPVARDVGSQLKESFQSADFAIGGATVKLAGVPAMALAAATAVAGVAREIGGAAVATFKFVNEQTKAADEVFELSKKVGVGVEELQRLQYAAKMSGVSGEALAGGLKKLNVNLLDMKNGGGKQAREALQEIGLSLADLEGKSKTQQIGVIADAMSIVASEADRAALAGKIFGKSAGPELAGLLAEGSAGIEALASSASGVFTEEQAQQAADYHDLLDQVDAQVGALARTLAIELLPIAKDMVQAVSDWVGENDEFIKQQVQFHVKELAEWLEIAKKQVNGLSEGLRVAIPQMNAFGSDTDIATTALSGFRFAVESVLNPLETGGSMIEFFTNKMQALGVVSETTAQAMKNAIAAIMDLEMGSSQVKTGINNQKDQRLSAINEKAMLDRLQRDYAMTGPTMNDMREGGKRKRERERKRKEAERAGKAADREAERERKKQEREAKAAAKEASGATWQELVSAVRSGNVTAVNKKIRDVSAGTSMGDKTPSVVITLINNVFNIDGAKEPRMVAAEVVREVRREFRAQTARAGQSLGGGLVR